MCPPPSVGACPCSPTPALTTTHLFPCLCPPPPSCSVLRAMDFQPRLGVVTRSLRVALPDLLHFALVAGCVFIGYSMMAYLIFGNSLSQFADFGTSVNTCFEMLLGNFGDVNTDLRALGGLQVGAGGGGGRCGDCSGLGACLQGRRGKCWCMYCAHSSRAGWGGESPTGVVARVSGVFPQVGIPQQPKDCTHTHPAVSCIALPHSAQRPRHTFSAAALFAYAVCCRCQPPNPPPSPSSPSHPFSRCRVWLAPSSSGPLSCWCSWCC